MTGAPRRGLAVANAAASRIHRGVLGKAFRRPPGASRHRAPGRLGAARSERSQVAERISE